MTSGVSIDHQNGCYVMTAKLNKTMLLGALLATTLLAAPAYALDDESVEAAVGGGLGGAIGAVIGNELGGESGAILGGALGAAGGAALTVDGDGWDGDGWNGNHRGRSGWGRNHCPPGHAKKGWC